MYYHSTAVTPLLAEVHSTLSKTWCTSAGPPPPLPVVAEPEIQSGIRKTGPALVKGGPSVESLGVPVCPRQSGRT